MRHYSAWKWWKGSKHADRSYGTLCGQKDDRFGRGDLNSPICRDCQTAYSGEGR